MFCNKTIRDMASVTATAPAEEQPGIWNRLWAKLKSTTDESKKPNKTLLILANSSLLHRQVIGKLQSTTTTKASTTLFSTTSKKRQETEKITEGFGLGYSYLELPLESDDTVTLDIYTFTYKNSIPDHKLMKQFLTRFNSKNDVTLLHVVDLETYTLNKNEDFSLEQVFRDTGSVCATMGQIFSNESSNKSIVDQFRRATGHFNEWITSTVTIEPSELGKGECDYPIGVDYALFVVGCDALSSMALTSLSQAEIDKLQQLLRLLVLKTGGSLCFFPNLIDEDSNVKHSIKSFKKYLLKEKFKPIPQVDDYQTLLIPKGWDTWGKIKVLNESFDFNRWNSSWLEIFSSQEERIEDTTSAENDSTLTEDYYHQYQDFLKSRYKAQLEAEIAVSLSPVKESPKKEYANSTVLLDEPDISSTSFHETHSVLQDFRLKFLEDDTDLLLGLQSTPGVSRFQDSVPVGSNAAKFKDFFNDLLNQDEKQ